MTLDDDLTEEELTKLAQKGRTEEKRAVARHPNASLMTLLFLSKEGFYDDVDQNPLLLLHVEAGSNDAVQILEYIAYRTARRERLIELSGSIFKDVINQVARNVNTPTFILAKLAKDKNHEVRVGVAYNKNVSIEILSALINDGEWDVRLGVAKNEMTSGDMLSMLANEDNFLIRRAVAKNEKTKIDILLQLAKDEEDPVSAAAEKTLAKINGDQR